MGDALLLALSAHYRILDAQGPSAAAIEAALDKMFAAPPTDPTEIDFARETAAAVSGALSSIGVQGKHDVLVSVG